jgi:CHAD domain-containing protein
MEREVKFAASPAYELPDLRRLVCATERLPAQSLTTTYCDTVDLRLWRRGLTLRFRAGEEPAGGGKWTLKLPGEAASDALERTELSWEGESETVPPEAEQLIKGIVRRAVLGRVVQLESTRRRLLLIDRRGTVLGEIDDDVVTVIGGARDGFRFRQIEFEYSGEPDADVVTAILKKITKAGAQLDHEQKFAKSLGISALASSVAPAPALARAANKKKGGHKKKQHADVVSLGSVVQQSILGALDRILDHDYRLRLSPADPPTHAVHQARVACRRLRSDLKTFGPLLDPVWLDHTTTELRWMGNVLGRVRDADVLGHRLADEATDGPFEAQGQQELGSILASERRQFAAELAEALEGRRYLKLLERLYAAAEAPPFLVHGKVKGKGKAGRRRLIDGPAQAALPELVGAQWKALERRRRKAGHHPSDHELHRIRIGAKQLRYAAEAATPVMGKAARRTARQAESVQTVLGDHHDAVTAAEWLQRAAANGTSAASFEAGALTATQRRRQRALRRQWKGPWSALKAKKSKQWLR